MPIGPTMGGLAPDAPKHHDVRHVCPECGGQLNTLQLAVVQFCWACFGNGTLDNDELAAYLQEHNRRVAEKGNRT